MFSYGQVKLGIDLVILGQHVLWNASGYAKICIKNSAIYNLTNAHHDRQVHGYG